MDFGLKTERYYKTMLELQEKLRKSEEERLKLEEKFNVMMRHTRDAEHERLRVLRHKYHKFLDEDKQRQDRNEAILQALDRVESRARMLAAKTDRFKLLRKQYESYMNLPKTQPTEPKQQQNPQDRSYIQSNTRRKLFSDHSQSADAKLAMLEQYLRDNFDNFPPDKCKDSILKQQQCNNQYTADSDSPTSPVPTYEPSAVLGKTIENQMERLRDKSPVQKQLSGGGEEPYVQDYKDLVFKSAEKYGLNSAQLSPIRNVPKIEMDSPKTITNPVAIVPTTIAPATIAPATPVKVSKKNSAEDSDENPIIKKYKEIARTLSEDSQVIPVETEEDKASNCTEPPLDISLSSPIQQEPNTENLENLLLQKQIVEESISEHSEGTEQVSVPQENISDIIIEEKIDSPEPELAKEHPETLQPQVSLHNSNYPESQPDYPPEQTQYQEYPEQNPEQDPEQYNYPVQDDTQGYNYPVQQQQDYLVAENSDGFNPNYVPEGTYPSTTSEGFDPNYNPEENYPSTTSEGFDPNYNPEENYPPTTSEGFDPNYVADGVYPSEVNPNEFVGDYPVQDEYQGQINADYSDNQNYPIQEPSGELYTDNQNDPGQESIQHYEQAENYPRDQQGYDQEYVAGDGIVYDDQQYASNQMEYPEGYQDQQYPQKNPQGQYNQDQYPQEYVEGEQYAQNPEQTEYDPNVYRSEQEYLEGEKNLDLQQGEYPVDYQPQSEDIPNQIQQAQEYQPEPRFENEIPLEAQQYPSQEDQAGEQKVTKDEELAISENSNETVTPAQQIDNTGPIVQKTMPNLADLLDTDSEHTKQETIPVSNDSDFDFSSSAQ